MAKTIVFCADGTWNGPGCDDRGDTPPCITNVLKLFLSLKGTDTADTVMLSDEQERIFCDSEVPTQVAKYLHGVGDSRNILVKLMGGVFGAGTITRIVRGYTYISRQYQPGDRIILVGFSRGAYTARALAAFIIGKGLLNPATVDFSDKESTYRRGAAAWYSYRKDSNHDASWTQRFEYITSNLPGFVSNDLPPDSLITGIGVHAIAVWETVGSLGIPQYAVSGERMDTFQFVSADLDNAVSFGFHAVSIDEERRDFAPTLWNERNAGNIFQALFPGAHADVGGGYPVTGGESGLSDTSLVWLRKELSNPRIGVALNDPILPFLADALGVSHQPWNEAPWNLPSLDNRPVALPRIFPSILEHASLGIHSSVLARWGQRARSAPQAALTNYGPTNIADLFDGHGHAVPGVQVY